MNVTQIQTAAARTEGQRQDERQLQRERQREQQRGFITPPANISATEDGYLIEVDMPGVDKDGLEVTLEGDELTIIGRRKWDLPEGEICYCESPLADYRRVFELGSDVDTGKITAEMQQGVLKLHLPKSEKAKPKKVEVKVA